ncbi:MAG: SPOR domain-containing protein [Acidobacteriota bacterium]
MHSKTLVSLFLLLALSTQSRAGEPSDYTIQVGAFADPRAAQAFADHLSRAGESAIWGEVEIPGRGRWTRIFIGSFDSQTEARRYGQRLIARDLIKEFIVKPAAEIKLLARSANGKDTVATENRGKEITATKEEIIRLEKKPDTPLLPASLRADLSLAPSVDHRLLPKPDPAILALKVIAAPESRGGLWISGDREEAMARLRWIAGTDSRLIELERNGRVKINTALLAKRAGRESGALKILDLISSNEGLFLLAQMTEGAARYLLHIGEDAPTFGNRVAVTGSLNFDNNFDSRINPHRRRRMKLDCERPPEGFDSMVAMNPSARWFNLRRNRLVDVSHVTFHELAEAYAKVALGLQYLAQGSKQGAHNLALEREERLQKQRPFFDLVTTQGINRLLRSESELRQVYAEMSVTGNQR